MSFAEKVVAFVTLASFLVPFLVLVGLFETRKNGTYCFLFSRFAAVLMAVLALNFVSSFFYQQMQEEQFTKGTDTLAADNLYAERARSNVVLLNLQELFPDALNGQQAVCLQKAIATTVDQTWATAYHDKTCDTRYKICASSADDYYEALLTKIKPYESVRLSQEAANISLQQTFELSTELRNLVKSKDNASFSTTVKENERLCENLSLPAWAQLGAPLVTEAPHMTKE